MKFNFLNGPNGEQSSKRLMWAACMVMFIIYFFANLFWGRILKQSIEDNIIFVMLSILITVSGEKLINAFAKKIETPKVEKDDSVSP